MISLYLFLGLRLGPGLRADLAGVAGLGEGFDPAEWARCTNSLVDVLEDSGRVLTALDEAEHRLV